MWILKSITDSDIYTPYYRKRLHIVNNVHENLLKLRKEMGYIKSSSKVVFQMTSNNSILYVIIRL